MFIMSLGTFENVAHRHPVIRVLINAHTFQVQHTLFCYLQVSLTSRVKKLEQQQDFSYSNDRISVS